MIKHARYIMIGGFLGAGKTTFISHLARTLTESGHRVGLITNDQATGLVDTLRVKNDGFSVEEISGGCFCCRFSSLHEAAERLNEQTRPDIFIGEPVGSCTDLLASVSYPLRRIYGDDFAISPLTVVVDAIRAEKIFGLNSKSSFSDKISYIYREQIKEASLLLINKMDLIDEERAQAISEECKTLNPALTVFTGQAVKGDGLDQLINTLISTTESGHPLTDLNYAIYAQGEEQLGWLNATIQVESSEWCNGNELISSLCAKYGNTVSSQGGQLAHLKMTLSPEGAFNEIASVSVVENHQHPMTTASLVDDIQSAELIVNMRAEATPVLLKESLEKVMDSMNEQQHLTLSLTHIESFKPQAPIPTAERAATLAGDYND